MACTGWRVEYNTWSCLCDFHADLAWSWPLLLKEGLHGDLIADSWQKETDLIVIIVAGQEIQSSLPLESLIWLPILSLPSLFVW